MLNKLLYSALVVLVMFSTALIRSAYAIEAPSLFATSTPAPITVIPADGEPRPGAQVANHAPQPTPTIGPTATTPTPTATTPTPTATTPLPTPTLPPTIPPPTPTPAINDTLGQSWQQFGGSGQHAGTAGDTALNGGNLGGLHQYWSSGLPASAESSAVLAGSVPVPGGQRAIVYVTTKSGVLVALDANTGATLWSAATNGPGWTYSAPALDPSNHYIYSYGLDGKVHKYAAGTGQEQYGGWPATITVEPGAEQGSSALTVAFGYLYATVSGYPGDGGRYIGHVVAINLSNAATHVWNVVCSSQGGIQTPNTCGEQGGGLWARAGVVADLQTGLIYVATGNATFAPYSGGYDWGESLVALTPDLSRVVDSYTPANNAQLQANDLDLGSTAPALLPSINGQLLLVQGGKDGILRLLNRRNLSGQGGPGHTGGEIATAQAPGGCAVFTAPLVYTDGGGNVWVIVMDDCGGAGYLVSANGLSQQWNIGQGGTSPVLENGVLFAVAGGKLFALNPTSGQQVWSTGFGGVFGQSPIAVDGRIYVPDDNGNLRCYGL